MCRKHGVSGATFYEGKAKYDGLDLSDARPLKALEDENAKQKKLSAEELLDNAMLQDVARKKTVTPAAIREAASHVRQVCEVSQRRACQVIGTDRSSIRYREDLVNAINPPCGPPRLLRGIA